MTKTYFESGTYPDPGAQVQIVRLESTRGYSVSAKLLQARRCPATGIAEQYVPGHGGDVWIVRHPDGVAAPYSVNEMCPEADPAAAPQVYDRFMAADYLGLSEGSIRYHVHTSKLLKTALPGKLVFTQQELDRFKTLPRKSGPKRGSKRKGSPSPIPPEIPSQAPPPSKRKERRIN